MSYPKGPTRIILVLSFFAILIGAIQYSSAELGASSDLSSKLHVGNSDIGSSSHENSSSHVGSNMSSEINSDTNATIKLNDNSDENSHAMSSEINSDTNATIKLNDNSDENSHAMSSESHKHYEEGYATISANSDDEFTVQTQKHLYKPGDNVSIQGSLWSSLISSLGNINSVSIQILDNNKNIVYSGNGQINSTGEYTAEFILPSDAKQGAYTVNVNADVSANVLDSLSLKTKDSLSSSTKIVVTSPNAFKVKSHDNDFDVEVASNSTVNNLNFDDQNKKLSFTVQGDTGTKGVSDITVPKTLLNGDLTVMIDGQAMAQSDVVQTSTDTDTTLEINYHHSTHQIDIVGTNPVPEFMAPLVLVLSVLSVIALSRTRLWN